MGLPSRVQLAVTSKLVSSIPASERPRLVVAADGSQIAVAEGPGIALFELPGRKRMAEINIDPDAESYDVGWLGSRLLVLSRFGAHTTVHLLDPSGPRTLSEIQLESPMRLYATVGSYALVGGAQGIAVLSATETHVTPYQFPARAVPTAACATAAGRFMVAVPGAIEEWDPQSRMPKRRLRLPRPATITALGASDRVVWMTTLQDPSRIDVVPLVNRGQPKAHDLAEPIAFAVGHSKSELVICLGAESGKLYAVDLDGRIRHRVLGIEGLDRVDAAALVAIRAPATAPSVAIAQAGRPLALVPLVPSEQREGEPAPPPVVQLPWSDDGAKRSTLVEDPDHAEPELPTDSLAAISTRANIAAPWGSRGTTSPGLESPLGFAGAGTEPGVRPESSWQSSLVEPPVETTAAARAFPTTRPPRPNLFASPASEPPAATSPRAGQDLSRRFSAWRERLKEAASSPASESPPEPVAPALPLPVVPVAAAPEPEPPITIERALTWRDELVAWRHARGPLPDVARLEQLAQRFDLSNDQVIVVALIYAAHLCGEPGIAPVDAARIVGWEDALGHGALAAAGIVTLDGSRLRLEEAIARMLDERPPRAGVVVGEPGPSTLLGPCVVLADGEPPLAIAERARASIGGGILVANRALDIQTLFVEAHARGLVPLVPLTALRGVIRAEPCVIVVDDPAALDELDLPRL